MFASGFVSGRSGKRQSGAAAAHPAAGLVVAAPFLLSKLTIWVVLQITAAAAAMGGVVAAGYLRREIAMPWPGLSPNAALIVGVAFWLGFGLLGGIRANQRPGGSVMTFSMPFIVAGTVLGGPVAGGLMGLVSEMEIRELRSQPLRGILANHAVSMLAAIVAGLAGEVARMAVAEPLASQQALAFLAVAGVTGLVFAVVNLILVIPTLAMRADVSLREAGRIIDSSVRTTFLAEGILAWLMAASYMAIGWWAPIVCIVLALIIWQAHNRLEALRHDEKTGLLNDLGFLPRLAAAVDRARNGEKRAALLLVDLDHFKAVNDTYLYESGDEVLRATAHRLLVAVRATDSVARLNRAGDEFALLLDDVPDLGMALRLATRIQDAIRQPVRLQAFDAEARVDASIGIVLLDREAALSSAEVLKLADARMLRGKALGSGIVALGDVDAGAVDAWQARERPGRQAQ
jgi:diguanylate cyclase (GGDEF)-like protein